jgi:hypothetical protein
MAKHGSRCWVIGRVLISNWIANFRVAGFSAKWRNRQLTNRNASQCWASHRLLSLTPVQTVSGQGYGRRTEGIVTSRRQFGQNCRHCLSCGVVCNLWIIGGSLQSTISCQALPLFLLSAVSVLATARYNGYDALAQSAVERLPYSERQVGIIVQRVSCNSCSFRFRMGL